VGVAPDPLRLAVDPVDRTLAALADPERRRTIELLRREPRRAGELSATLGLTPAAMSRHLRVLRESGLIEERHPDFDARVRIYSLRPQPVATLRAWLEETERGWQEQLAAFKSHIESR
jgi:DNA-binding transcriptional ArsR family regulator